MKFKQNNPLVEYRQNLILAALVKVDHLKRLSGASMSLSKALAPFREPDGFIDLVNQLAYNAIEQIVPEVIAEVAQEELQEIPICADEVNEVLNRPLSSVLHMLQHPQSECC